MTSEALNPLPDLSRDVPGHLTAGQPPAPIMVAVNDLRVNSQYQRDLTPKSHKAIRNIIRQFSWARFGAIIIAPQGDVFEIIDGQHRAIAAKALGADVVPAIVSNPENLAGAAADFVGINSDRSAVTAGAKFKARLVAGDKHALAVSQLAQECGVRILATPPADGWAVGDTMAAVVLERIYKAQGARILRRILTILVAAARRPLRAGEMRMLATLMADEVYHDSYTDDQLIAALTTFSMNHIEGLASEHAEETGDSRSASKALILWRVATHDYGAAE